jgi:D-alanyl-lipoteichoic acid acyltransferase DltB (MBOAT superfamily)
MSLFFYWYANSQYLVFLLVMIAANYGFSAYFGKNEGNQKLRKTVLVTAIVLNVGFLFYFKYTNFFLENLNTVFKTDYALTSIVLPLGISFFTFQQISYLVDSYRNQVKPTSILNYAVFSSFFPVITSGPIVLHGSVIPQLDEEERHHFKWENFNRGIYLFTLGLAKKVLIADTLGKVVSAGYAELGSLSSFSTVLVIISYSLQLYFDFSGYSDMARGVSRMLNIDIPVNFNSPYKAESINDFWKRWHITLTDFLREYIYFPLGGSRKGSRRTYINIILVFLVSGLWHGAAWTFILWGLLHGIAQCIGRKFQNTLGKLPKAAHVLITFIFVNLAWVVFRSENISQAGTVLGNLFSNKTITSGSEIFQNIYITEFKTFFQYLGLRNGSGLGYLNFINDHALIIATVIIAVLLIAVFFGRNSDEIVERYKPDWKHLLVISILLFWCIISLGSVSTFLYTNF